MRRMNLKEQPIVAQSMSEKNDTLDTRQDAMNKRRLRQEVAAEKAMKEFGKSVAVNGLVGPGAVVTLKVDY